MTRLRPHSNVLQLLDSFDVEFDSASLEHDDIVSEMKADATKSIISRGADTNLLQEYLEVAITL
ncbi:hypothetical protein BGW42_004933 [Actinomortierella wolfii]|nr:hypothetical protein BGW42_004933 [Actinomortierella wolfii]